MFEPGHSFYQKLQKSGNPLLVKDDVGQAKVSTRTLPAPGFTYGKNLQRDAVDAWASMHQWNQHQASKALLPDRDFNTLNKLALRNGRLTAKDQTEFRKKTDARLKNTTGRGSAPVLPNPGQTFGMPGRPSTPIAGVIGNLYGRVAAEMKHEEYNHSNEASPRLTRPKLTKAASMLMTAIRTSSTFVKKEKSNFKMKKFLKTSPRVETNLKPKEVQPVS